MFCAGNVHASENETIGAIRSSSLLSLFFIIHNFARKYEPLEKRTFGNIVLVLLSLILSSLLSSSSSFLLSLFVIIHNSEHEVRFVAGCRNLRNDEPYFIFAITNLRKNEHSRFMWIKHIIYLLSGKSEEFFGFLVDVHVSQHTPYHFQVHGFV